MAQNIRLTITPDLQKALDILDRSTMGTLNTTELIKLAVGGYARVKQMESGDIVVRDMNRFATRQMREWAKDDGTIIVNNIASGAKSLPFQPEPYVRDS